MNFVTFFSQKMMNKFPPLCVYVCVCVYVWLLVLGVLEMV